MATVSVETAAVAATPVDQDTTLPAYPFIPQSPEEHQAAQEEFKAGNRTLAYVQCRKTLGAGAVSGYASSTQVAVFFPKDHFGHYGLEALNLAREYVAGENTQVASALWFYDQATLEAWTKQQAHQGQND